MYLLFFSAAKDFIRNMMQKNPKMRYTTDLALRHPWWLPLIHYTCIMETYYAPFTHVDIFLDFLALFIVYCNPFLSDNQFIHSLQQDNLAFSLFLSDPLSH